MCVWWKGNNCVSEGSFLVVGGYLSKDTGNQCDLAVPPPPPQTDGASAALLMSEEKALRLGFKPKAYLRCVLLCTCARLPAGTLYNYMGLPYAGTMFLCHKIQRTSFCLGELGYDYFLAEVIR